MQLMPAENDTLAVLKYVLNPQKCVAPKLVASWQEIEKELSEQTVTCLPADYLSAFGVTEVDKITFTKKSVLLFRHFNQILADQDLVAKTLEETNYVILKGTAAARYYPRPELRQMGDIDILVSPNDYDKVISLTENAEFIKDILNKNERHNEFITKSGTRIEIHRRFSSAEFGEVGRILDSKLLDGLNRREICVVCGHSVPVLPKLENGLVLLSHIYLHLSSGLGLRQIIDWMMYVRENLDDSYWQNSFRKATEDIGMKNLAEVTTLMCKKYLGLDEITWCDGADEELADDLLDYVIKKGNFGRKEELESKNTVSVLRLIVNPIMFFRYLEKSGIVHWKAAQKYKILKPFAWIYQIGYLVYKGLQRKVQPSKILDEAKQSKKEYKLLKKLNLTNKR